MNKNSKDRRKLSGSRVLAKCEVVLPVSNPFAHFYNNVKTGYMVLNIRGGCLYLEESITKEHIEKIFPDEHTTVFDKLTLFLNDKPEIVIKKIKVTFVRLKQEENREGVVFRFTDISEEHLDTLNTLRFKLPIISSDEESSVPFHEIITLDRSDQFELL